MMGHADLDRPRVPAVAADGLRRRPDGKVQFFRVACGVVEAAASRSARAGGQGSHQLTGDGRAPTRWPCVPDGDGVAPGGDVDVILLSLPGQ